MPRMPLVHSLFLLLLAMLLGACSGDGSPTVGTALSADHVNLIFVVSPDATYSTPGDIDATTANLSSQGLQRSLMMATYLKQQVLGGKNVKKIYALAPMTHLQTENQYPDMAAIGFIQQFALLNQIAFSNYTANNFPINASYAQGGVPTGVAPLTPPATNAPTYCPDCTGLDYNNTGGDNDALVSGIIDAKNPGFYVFSAPWGTISAMLAKINTQYSYNLNLPTAYQGTNVVYAISIPSSGKASLVTYDSKLNPPATYPVLPAPVATAACSHPWQPYFKTVLTGGVNGVTIPAGMNTNSRIYIVRHAEAHPDPTFSFDDGNYVAAGQWRALSLANTLRGRISPSEVYSIDPSALWYSNGVATVSYVRPSLTVLPYAIANKLPYYLAADLALGSPYTPTAADIAQNTSNYFFTGGKFSNKTVLVAWESGHIKPFLNALIGSYGGNNVQLLPTAWPAQDYDTIWTVSLDAQGNLTVDNELCEGIDSAYLPATAPLF